MRRAAATACPICSRRGSPGGAPSVGAPPRPGPDCSLPGAQQGAARSNSALQPLARPHSPGTSGRPRPRPGTRGESCHRSWSSLFCTFFPRWTPGPPRGAGGWALSAGLSISAQHLASGLSAAARLLRPRRGPEGPRRGPKRGWHGIAGAADLAQLAECGVFPGAKYQEGTSSEPAASASGLSGPRERGTVRWTGRSTGCSEDLAPREGTAPPPRPPERTARPRRPPFPHLQNFAVRPKRSLRSCLSTKNGYILTISARTRAACQGLRPRFHFWALVSYYDDGLHSSLHMVPAPARGSQEGGGSPPASLRALFRIRLPPSPLLPTNLKPPVMSQFAL